MNKNIAYKLALCMLSLIVFVSCDKKECVANENGVSKELAIMRSNAIKDLQYRLEIFIPESIEDTVTGHCEITFEYNGNCDLPIDYKSSQEGSNTKVLVNGNEMMLPIENEHIILPKKSLRKGSNAISMNFISNDKTLNRHPDYMYTLFVPANARTAFPCFDQPDLKARFSLSLIIPKDWEALSNAPIKTTDKEITSTDIHRSIEASGNYKCVAFETSQPLPTYLMSLAAGKFTKSTYQKDGRAITAFYRNDTESRRKDIEKSFEIIDYSINWLERYTGIPYPFDKYDFIVLPGYQFGGMEHPGAIQYNDSRIFIGENATPDEEKARFNLLAHETSHIWFGDMVTMKWFDDVWTKEVFANLMADKICEGMYPQIDNDLNFVKAHYDLSYATDYTAGSHPIQQHLDNLNEAGLLYGNIIYHKAPIMMKKLEELIGESNLQKALQTYLNKYRYGNATWDDLIEIMQDECEDGIVMQFDKTWVKQASLPHIDYSIRNDSLCVYQIDAEGGNRIWDQYLSFGVYNSDFECIDTIKYRVEDKMYSCLIPSDAYAILPNSDGLGYGRFMAKGKIEIPIEKLNDIQRLSLSRIYYDNYLLGNIGYNNALEYIIELLNHENNPIIASAQCNYLINILKHQELDTQAETEMKLYDVACAHPMQLVKKLLMRGLATNASSEPMLDITYKLWKDPDNSLFAAKDYIKTAYHLAIMMPEKGEEILNTQRSRLKSKDEIDEFDYVSECCLAGKEERKKQFLALIQPQNRINEPWAIEKLSLLCHKIRQSDAIEYITPGLDSLKYIQSTSDIFFPYNWLKAMLCNQKSSDAKAAVKSWLNENDNIPATLANKVKEAANL